MANPEHLDILKSGPKSWNKWKENEESKKGPFFQADLTGANLQDTDLTDANLRYVDLRNADLRNVNMKGVDFKYAKLEKANLSNVDFSKVQSLHGTDFSYANLTKTIFKDLDCFTFYESSFSCAIMTDADLSGANLSAEELYEFPYRGGNINKRDQAKASVSGLYLVPAFSHNNFPAMDFYRGPSFYKTDLRNANLLKTRLRHVSLSNADLRNANLAGADLLNSDLNESNLEGAFIHRAYLFKTSLKKANLKNADLSNSNLSNADLTLANLENANLQECVLVNTNFEASNLTGCSVYGISAWNVVLKNTKQLDLLITKAGESAVRVDDLEIAQFVHLLLNREKLRNVITTLVKKAVLILGRFGGGGLELLRDVANKLREFDYLPIIFDFERPEGKNYTETIKTLVGLSRFVIVDLSGPSVPQELYATVPHFKIPFVPIIEKGKRTYAMFTDLLEYNWVIKPILEFESKDMLIDQLLSKVIKPAEDVNEKRLNLLRELYNE